MKPSDYIVDVSEADFEIEVIAYSERVPVVVDFWAEWCAPCRVLGPLLERLAGEAQGGFRLAKLNVDQNPNLTRRYKVRSIPAVKGIRDGQVVAEFTGALPEQNLREFLRSLAPGEDELQLAKGQSLLEMRKWSEAEACFQAILQEHPRYSAARLGLAKSLLLQGKTAEGQLLLKDFPDGKEFAMAEALRPLAGALAWAKSAPPSDDPLEAAYQNALRLVMRGNLLAAMDGILEVLRQDKRFREQEPRKVMVALLDMMDPNDALTRQYRNEFALVLF